MNFETIAPLVVAFIMWNTLLYLVMTKPAKRHYNKWAKGKQEK